jgi:hypothetical protein
VQYGRCSVEREESLILLWRSTEGWADTMDHFVLHTDLPREEKLLTRIGQIRILSFSAVCSQKIQVLCSST